MIKNIPTPNDFAEHGLMFLNLAWDTIFDLSREYADAEQWGGIVDKEQTDEYLKATKRPLSIAHALAQQGAELILKSEVANVSPFLLITASPSDWPKGCEKSDTFFADFRTIDAQDLVRVCNAVRGSALPESFVTTFNKFRKQRNALFHTVDERLEFSEKEIIRYILTIAHLTKPGQWPHLREAHLCEMPLVKLYSIDYVSNVLCEEMDIMIGLLERTDLREWFGFNKNQRRYICPTCHDKQDHQTDPPYPRTAQLKPNDAKSTNLHCFVCGNDIPVTRRNCPEMGCKGNVIHAADDNECLTCFKPAGDVG
jgi:hypothetical protein